MAESLAEENSRLRGELANFRANTHTEQKQIAATKAQLVEERNELNAQTRVVREFMRAFNALNNAIISDQL